MDDYAIYIAIIVVLVLILVWLYMRLQRESVLPILAVANAPPKHKLSVLLDGMPQSVRKDELLDMFKGWRKTLGSAGSAAGASADCRAKMQEPVAALKAQLSQMISDQHAHEGPFCAAVQVLLAENPYMTQPGLRSGHIKFKSTDSAHDDIVDASLSETTAMMDAIIRVLARSSCTPDGRINLDAINSAIDKIADSICDQPLARTLFALDPMKPVPPPHQMQMLSADPQPHMVMNSVTSRPQGRFTPAVPSAMRSTLVH